MSFYSSKGQYLVRMANGPSKERIQTDKAFKRTRENNMEFGGSAKAAKSLRLSMGGLITNMAGTRFTAELTAVFKKMNLNGTGARGKRSITLTQNKGMLKNLEFNSKLSFSSIFTAPFINGSTVDRRTGTITIPAFNAEEFVRAPAGATHFKMVSALGIVSNFLYDDELNSYDPVAPEEHEVSAAVEGPLFSIDGSIPMSNVSAAIAGSDPVDDQCAVIHTLGIIFYQRVDGVDYMLAQGNTMKIINVF